MPRGVNISILFFFFFIWSWTFSSPFIFTWITHEIVRGLEDLFVCWFVSVNTWIPLILLFFPRGLFRLIWGIMSCICCKPSTIEDSKESSKRSTSLVLVLL